MALRIGHYFSLSSIDIAAHVMWSENAVPPTHSPKARERQVPSERHG